MDTLCQRLEQLVGKLTDSLGAIDRTTISQGHDTINDDLVQAAQVLRSMPELRAPIRAGESQVEGLPRDILDYPPDKDVEPSISSDEDTDSIPDHHGLGSSASASAEDAGGSSRAGALVRDSYGHLR